MNKTLSIDETTHLAFPTLDYTAALFDIIQSQRPYLEAHLPWVKNIQKEWHAHGFLREAMMMNKGKQRLTTLIIHEEQLAGTVSLLKINHPDKRAEMGYWLRSDLQGLGIMTKACQRLVQYAFKGLHLNRLEMRIVTSNQKSRRIPLRLGFTLEGRLRGYQVRKGGGFEDVEIFGLLRRDNSKKN